MEQERRLLGMCDHPRLLRLLGAYQDASFLYLLFELVQGGEVFSLIADVMEGKRPMLTERDVAFYVANVASASSSSHTG